MPAAFAFTKAVQSLGGMRPAKTVKPAKPTKPKKKPAKPKKRRG